MISFLKTIGASRKGWTYHGVLPVRVPSDYSTKHHPDVFDPTNYVYSGVILRNVPDLQHQTGRLCEPSWSTMGDCIESLLAYANAGKQHQWKQVGTLEAAHFFREMSYSYYRINRVIPWDRHTTRKMKIMPHELFPRAQKSTKCLCTHVPDPHPSTMKCSNCNTQGCAFIIHLHSGTLWCTTCEPADQRPMSWSSCC